MQKEMIRMKSHGKKMIAPMVVTVIIILYYIVYFGLLLSLLDGTWKIILGIIPLLLSIATVRVCIERIREIRKGEEDDLSQY